MPTRSTSSNPIARKNAPSARWTVSGRASARALSRQALCRTNPVQTVPSTAPMRSARPCDERSENGYDCHPQLR